MSSWYDVDNLYQCWLKVKQKGAQGGIDNRTIDHYRYKLRSRLEKLSAALHSEKYVPEPGKRFNRKKSDGGTRPISLTTVEDKIVQTAVKNEIEPVFEKQFLPVSYAYRPGRGHRKAIHNIDHFLSQNMRWIITCDIDNFFDSINHRLLIQMLGEKIHEEYILHLIEMWLKIGAFAGDKYIESKAGVPQGGVISPLLSNIYLHPFDVQMQKRRAHYVRYADDFILIEKTGKTAEAHYAFSADFLKNELYLKLNQPEKPLFASSEGFVFLGIHFKEGRKFMAPKKARKAIGKIESLLGPALKHPFSDTINKLNETLTSWQYYYGECDNRQPFNQIQQKIFEKLAYYVYRISEEGKRPEYSYLNGNLNRLKLLIPLEAKAKKALFKQILDGKKRIKYDGGEEEADKRKTPALTKQERKGKATEEKSRGLSEIKRAVAVKKRKYQRQFASDYDLVLSDYGTFIGRHLKRLVVKKGKAKPKEFAVSKVKHILVLNPSVSFSSAAIYLCSQNNIAIDFLDYQGKPFARLSAPDQPAWPYGLYQLEARENDKGLVMAKAFVEGKIRNQTNLMKYFSKYRKSRDSAFMEIFEQEVAKLTAYIKEVDKIDPDLPPEKARGSLLGIEGRAGAAYWRLVRNIVEERVEFKKREHRGAKDLFNSLLNYGYGILYSRVWGALMQAGLNVQIGFLHSPQYQKPTLIYDAVEEFRAQVVDRVVISLISRGEKLSINKKGYLTKESKDKLIENVFERLNTPVKFRKKQRTLQEIIHYQARAMGKYLKEGRPVYSPFIAKW